MLTFNRRPEALGLCRESRKERTEVRVRRQEGHVRNGLESYFKQVGISADKNDCTYVRNTHGDPESKKAPLDEQTYPDPRYPNRPLRVSHFIVRERLMETFY
jgi:hypothetical protein